MDETDINAKVRGEMARFREALPELLNRIPGKWIVFKDGQVHGAFDVSVDAHQAGVRLFGRLGGQVIAQVVEETPKPINAVAMFYQP